MNEDLYMTWGNHSWMQPMPRHYELESGQSIFQRRCTRCGRDFVVDMSSGARHAVHVSIFSFSKLRDEVTQRWVGENCPGKRLQSDDDDRKREVGELRIAWGRTREIGPSAHASETPGSHPEK